MKKIAIIMLSICLLVAFSATPAMAAKPTGNGFDQDGVNLKARVFNGWLGDLNELVWGGDHGTDNAWIVLKWSKDWEWGSPYWLPPNDATAVGAWMTLHQTEYYDEGYQLLEWVDKNSIPEDAVYRGEMFFKVMKVGDNEAAWEAYSAGGAANLGWGNYEPSGVPEYVLFQMTWTLYERDQSDVWVLIDTEEGSTTSPKGLGHPIF